jgi:hypothetical protein
MFYAFNSFWYGVTALCATWMFYSLFDYEACVVTLLTLIFLQTKRKDENTSN